MNAFCHTDYFMRSNIKIEFYKDKCIITSPGGIFNASLEDIMGGKQTYRNPKLVHIFDKLGLIENFGTGIPRTKEAYENEEVNPEFEASDHFFTVILPNLNYVKREIMNDPINDPINDLINEALNDIDLEVLRNVSLYPGMNSKQIYNRIREKGDVPISYDMIKNSIKRKLKNRIEFKGPNKNGGYYIK